jgi:hypothetical protein
LHGRPSTKSFDEPGFALGLNPLGEHFAHERFFDLFEKNPCMRRTYPTEESMWALTAFQIYEGSGEWFDLSRRPIERASYFLRGSGEGGGGMLHYRGMRRVRKLR